MDDCLWCEHSHYDSDKGCFVCDDGHVFGEGCERVEHEDGDGE